jgi:hypothetical protein
MTTVSPAKDEVERHVETLARMKFKTMPKAQWDAISAAQDALEAAAMPPVDRLRVALEEAKLQLEYLDEVFAKTGTTAAVIARIDAALGETK